MKTDQKLIDAIGQALQIVITFHEVDHAYEKIATRWRYKGLLKWFDKYADKSRDWRRCLEGMLTKYQAPMNIALNAKIIDSEAPMRQFLTDQAQMGIAIRNIVHQAYLIAEKTDDSTAADKLCDLQASVEKMLVKLEAFSRQIADIGIESWLANKL